MSAKLSVPIQYVAANYPQWLLGALLLSLHVIIVWGAGAWWAGAAVLVHLGLFLVWQPVLSGEQRLSFKTVVLVFLAGALAFQWWQNGWGITLWLGILVGLVGGNVAGIREKRQRLGYLFALLYLLGILLLWVVPHLFAGEQGMDAMGIVVRYGLPVLPVLVALVPRSVQAPRTFYAVDFFYSLMLFLLVVILVLGSFTLKMLNQSNYPMALTQALLVMAGILLVLRWLWNPHGGFAGGGHMMSRYLLSVGLPFEHWLRNLATLAESEEDPQDFLRLALRDIAELPWVTGGKWSTPTGGDVFGSTSRYFVEFTFHSVTLVLYTRWALSPALVLHVRLLAQLLGEFFETKLREKEQKNHAYLQAIHETGARLTHDVKNLLQSLTALSAAVADSDESDAIALQSLMQRQLPQVTQRLQMTLDKICNPQANQPGSPELVLAGVWWTALQQRYEADGIEFDADGLSAKGRAGQIPAEVFDSVADNLLQNALRKRVEDRDLTVKVSLSGDGGADLSVCDNGLPLQPHLATGIFHAPVKSENGLGVGLYQAGRLATQSGYIVKLSQNQPGRVCFSLVRQRMTDLPTR
ncbi:MAG: sensor histidine kinase [Sulfuricellaceae bacterium]|nr:sensor histidine kinase [Sulfuricellaceae bacterium]